MKYRKRALVDGEDIIVLCSEDKEHEGFIFLYKFLKLLNACNM